MSLDDLINRLLEYQGGNYIASRIDNLPKLCRPRSALATIKKKRISDEYDEPIEISIAFRYMFLIYTPQEAISRCCSIRPLVDLYQEITASDRFDYNADTQEVGKALLEAFDVPFPKRGTSVIRSPSEAVAWIQEIENSIMRNVDKGLTNTSNMQGGIITAWALVEGVLKFSLAFFARHFEAQLPADFFSRLKNGLRKGTGRGVIRLFEDTERVFLQGEPNSAKRARARKIQEELAIISNSEVRRQKRLELLSGKAKEEDEMEEYAKALQASCERDFGRSSPFQYVKSSKYDELYGLERNEFAHKPLTDIIKGTDESERVNRSLEAARNIINGLRRSRAAPRIITVLGEGLDWYGNPIIMFSDRENINQTLPKKELVEWMYPAPGKSFASFQELIMMAPDTNQSLSEPIIEPIMYQVEEIQSLLNAEETTKGESV